MQATTEILDLVRVTDGLFACAPQELGFAPGIEARSFLLRGGEGNLMLYGSGGALRSAEAVEAHGGVDELWLGHWHEAGMGAAAAVERLGPRVYVHRPDLAETRARMPGAQPFDGALRVRRDLEAIPIPGHTPGSVAYLWQGPEARCLFTADSLYMRRGELKGAVLGSSDRAAFLASMERLKAVEFDLLVPWVADRGAPPATPYAPEAWRRALDAVIARVQAGGEG